MAEELNRHFSSVFTREDSSSLPVPETKFKGSEGERLGQLVVTPEVVVSKINNMKENKSPGVDGISPKILKETVEQISTPLAHVFNMSLQEGIIPFEWKEANIIPLFKKGSRNKSVNYMPVSLTSVICKLLESIIRDHMMDFLKLAKVIPVFKKGDSKLINNYRPISLLPVISKVLEKIIANQLSQYFEDNKLFHDNQYGFRTGLSSEYATIELTDRIISNTRDPIQYIFRSLESIRYS